MKDRWEMGKMKLQSAAANHVVTGEKSCVLCSTDFKYVAIVSGEKTAEDLSSFHKDKVITNQVIVLKKSLANNGTLQIIDVEITLKCPHCHSNQRTNQFLSLAF